VPMHHYTWPHKLYKPSSTSSARNRFLICTYHFTFLRNKHGWMHGNAEVVFSGNSAAYGPIYFKFRLLCSNSRLIRGRLCLLCPHCRFSCFNPLMGTGNYSTISNNMKLIHWPLMGGLLHLVQR